MNARIPLRLNAAGTLAALSLAGALAGCSFAAGEVSNALNDPDVGDVLERFEAMTEIPGEPNGSTVVETSGPGTVWALTRRDDTRKVAPSDCSVDGTPMGSAAESLNLPEPETLNAEGKQQTLFAFASATVGEAGALEVTCDLTDAPALLLLFEPEN